MTPVIEHTRENASLIAWSFAVEEGLRDNCRVGLARLCTYECMMLTDVGDTLRDELHARQWTFTVIQKLLASILIRAHRSVNMIKSEACQTHAFNVPFFVVPAVLEHQHDSAKRNQEGLPELIPTMARIVVKEQLDTATILQDQEQQRNRKDCD